MSSPARRRRLEIEQADNGITVVNFIDRKIIDEQNIQVIGEQLFALVDEDGRKDILLSFGNVEYLSSAALGKCITLKKKCTNVGGKLMMCRIDPAIFEVFEQSKLDKFFEKTETEEQGRGVFKIITTHSESAMTVRFRGNELVAIDDEVEAVKYLCERSGTKVLYLYLCFDNVVSVSPSAARSFRAFRTWAANRDIKVQVSGVSFQLLTEFGSTPA